MSTFTFTYECGWENTKVIHECEADCLDEILSNFENFLKGAGYQVQGVLDFVDPDGQDIDFEPASQTQED